MQLQNLLYRQLYFSSNQSFRFQVCVSSPRAFPVVLHLDHSPHNALPETPGRGFSRARVRSPARPGRAGSYHHAGRLAPQNRYHGRSRRTHLSACSRQCTRPHPNRRPKSRVLLHRFEVLVLPFRCNRESPQARRYPFRDRSGCALKHNFLQWKTSMIESNCNFHGYSSNSSTSSSIFEMLTHFMANRAG
jgi:hypothetical protein